MYLRYLTMGSLVTLGVFAFARRDFVLDAFDWNSPRKAIEVPLFDPVTKVRQLRTPPPAVKALHVEPAADTREAPSRGLAPDPTPTPVELSGGTTMLEGRVVGPSGAVANATVRIERFVDERVAAVDLATNSAGQWSLANVPGGRYRIRAWRAPSFAQPRSEVAFVVDGEQRSFVLAVDSPGGSEIDTSYSGSFIVGSEPQLSVTVEGPYVTSSGIVRYGGRAGLTATLSVGGSLVGGGAMLTDADGTASWRVTCATIGSTFAQVDVAGTSQAITIPACAPVPTTTTTTTTTTTRPATTTTTGGTGTTTKASTTTTRTTPTTAKGA